MFIPFIPHVWYDKTHIFWIRSTIIWYWLSFITFIIRLVPYIGWWGYVSEIYLILNIRYFFLNALLVHSQVVINFYHYCRITIFQAKNSKTKKNNIEKYKSPFPWFIIRNLPNCFVEFVISSNTDELSRRYIGLKIFRISKFLCIPIVYPANLVPFPLNITMFQLWNSWHLDLNTEWALWYIPEPKPL